MEGMEDEDSGWSVAFETEKGVEFMDLPLIMTIEGDLSALSSRPAQVRAVVQRESKVWAPETVADIRLRSSVEALSKGSLASLLVNLGTLTCKEYASVILILAKKRIIERVQRANIPVDVYVKHLLLTQRMTLWISLCSNFQPVLSTAERRHIYAKQKQSICGDGPIHICNVKPYSG